MARSPVSPAERHAARVAFATRLPVVQRAYRAAADKAVGRFGLSQAMAWPLVMIGRHAGEVRPGALADVLGVEPASLVRQLDQLEAAGLVERREHPTDRRAKTLHLTPAGRQARAKIEAALDGLRNELFDGIPDADVAAGLRLFDALEANLARKTRARAVVKA